MKRICATLCASLVATIVTAGPGFAGRPAREEFARYVLSEIGALVEDCPDGARSEWPARSVICAVYGKRYSRFKSDWDSCMRRHDLPARGRPTTPWKLSGGRYRRDYEVAGDELTIVFDENRGRVRIAFVAPEPAEEPGRDTGTNSSAAAAEPLTAGFGGVSTPRLVPESRVPPVYPERAKKERIEGSVLLEVVVRRDGGVGETKVLRCRPEGWGLETAAMDAVRQWRYEPALLDGEPVEVRFTVYVEFVLPDSS